jgi:hypothetical protein
MVQIEFEGRSGPMTFQEGDCVLFGANDTYIAAELCLQVAGDSMHAGKLRHLELGIAYAKPKQKKG